MNAEEILHSAVEKRTPAERAAYLDAACGENRELRAQIGGLLQAHEDAGSFLEGPLFKPEMTVDYSPGPEKPGTVIGPYKLLQQLGEGGMGTVFLAEQTQPLQRKVAIKVIKPGMDSRQVLARFEQERQALAVMDHPNIAKVFDAGTTASGRPFFVMELVKGVPITQYCDQEHLTPKERLKLFIPVCHAVQHAHQKGIIHRDLKPSNVLIALYDGTPVPKVIDFGVAKATGQKLTEKTMFTEVGQVVGTLEYMAPEQAELNNLDIDTRADIYALGTVLYELLAGSPPFTREQLKGVAFTEMLRMIREVEPSKPSTKLSSSAELPSLAAQRKLEPERLTRLVQGDLDWIVMKCLEKDRARRYETANGLAQDIGRYLVNEPVLARPPHVAYRMRKFLRRNRGAVVAASFVLISLVLGVTGTTVGLVQAEERRWEAEKARASEAVQRGEAEKAAREAEAKRKEAETNLGFAKKGNEILGSVFAGLDPKANYATVADLRNALRDNLSKAVQELEGSGIGDPVEVAAMQNTLAESLVALGEASLAVEVCRKAMDTRKCKLGPEHPDTLRSMNNLAVAYKESGQVDKFVPLFEETLEKRKRTLGHDHDETLESMTNLAAAYLAKGWLDKAVPVFAEILDRKRARLGANHPGTLDGMADLAPANRDSSQLNKAIELLEGTLASQKARLGPDHSHTLDTMHNLSLVYRDSGPLNKSLQLFEEALEKKKARLGPDHSSTLSTMNYLAETYLRDSQVDKALTLLGETLERRRAILGPDHRDTLDTMEILADAYRMSGQPDKAVPLFETTLEKWKATRGSEDFHTLLIMTNLAAVYMESAQLGRNVPMLGAVLLEKESWTKAENILRECLAIREKIQPDAWITFQSKSMLGGSLLGQKKYADAEPLLLAGYEGMKQRGATIPPQGKIRLTDSLERLVKLYDDWGKKAEANKWRKKLEEAKAAAKSPGKQ